MKAIVAYIIFLSAVSAQTVSDPVISVSSGEYPVAKVVTVSCGTAGAAL